MKFNDQPVKKNGFITHLRLPNMFHVEKKSSMYRDAESLRFRVHDGQNESVCPEAKACNVILCVSQFASGDDGGLVDHVPCRSMYGVITYIWDHLGSFGYDFFPIACMYSMFTCIFHISLLKTAKCRWIYHTLSMAKACMLSSMVTEDVK